MRLAGLLVTEGTGEPVAGAIVALVDAEDAVLGETLSNESGAFNLPLPPPGVYRVRVTRIGYESWASDALHLPAPPESRALRLEVPVRPIPLPDLLVTEQNDCPTTPEERERAFELYESVLPVLRTVSSTADLGTLVMRMVRPVRAWNRGAMRYRYDSVTVVVEQSLNNAPPEHLAAHGYADVIRDSMTTFYAPDGDALASPGFLATHCLDTADSEDESLAGLAFEPRPGRELVDVEGVLWIDTTSAAPRELEFQYTSLRDFLRRYMLPPLREAVLERHKGSRVKFYRILIQEDFGGELHFGRLANGRWLIREWEISRPGLGHIADFGPGGASLIPDTYALTTSGKVLAIIPP